MNKKAWSDYITTGNLDTEPEFEDALTIYWWQNLNLDINYLFPLLQQFGDLQEWTAKAEGLRSFGDAETNDISVCFDDATNKIQELICRLDLRKIEIGFINKVLSLAAKFDCLFMNKQGRLFQPTITELTDTIQLSNAKQFVANPKQFLEDLSKGFVTPE